MNAASHRDTKYEISTIKQEANGWTVTFSQRGVHGDAPPPFYVSEDEFGLDGLKSMHDLFEAIEVKLEAAIEAKQITPESAFQAMRDAQAAQRQRDAAIAEKAAVDEEIRVAREELSKLQAARAEVAVEP